MFLKSLQQLQAMKPISICYFGLAEHDQSDHYAWYKIVKIQQSASMMHRFLLNIKSNISITADCHLHKISHV